MHTRTKFQSIASSIHVRTAFNFYDELLIYLHDADANIPSSRNAATSESPHRRLTMRSSERALGSVASFRLIRYGS